MNVSPGGDAVEQHRAEDRAGVADQSELDEAAVRPLLEVVSDGLLR